MFFQNHQIYGVPANQFSPSPGTTLEMDRLASSSILRITVADPLDNPLFLVRELWFLLFLQFVYSYYLEWNFLTLLIRVTQVGWLSRLAASVPRRKSAVHFLCLSNLAVVGLHLMGKSHPFSVNFIGLTKQASMVHVLLVDLVIVYLELLMVHLLAIIQPGQLPTHLYNYFS